MPKRDVAAREESLSGWTGMLYPALCQGILPHPGEILYKFPSTQDL